MNHLSPGWLAALSVEPSPTRKSGPHFCWYLHLGGRRLFVLFGRAEVDARGLAFRAVSRQLDLSHALVQWHPHSLT